MRFGKKSFHFEDLGEKRLLAEVIMQRISSETIQMIFKTKGVRYTLFIGVFIGSFVLSTYMSWYKNLKSDHNINNYLTPRAYFLFLSE